MGGKTWPPWSYSDCCPVLIIGVESNAGRKKLELPCPGKKPYAQQRTSICRAITCSRVVARYLEEEATAKKKKKYKFLWSFTAFRGSIRTLGSDWRKFWREC